MTELLQQTQMTPAGSGKLQGPKGEFAAQGGSVGPTLNGNPFHRCFACCKIGQDEEAERFPSTNRGSQF